MADQVPIIVVPTVTKLGQSARGAVVIGGSHAAIFTTYLTVAAGALAAIQHDACIGREHAGISGLVWAEQFGFAMAAVSGESARIGDGEDMRSRGLISTVNRFAHAAGIRPGMRCEDAATILQTAPPPTATASPLLETRSIVTEDGKEIVVVDSVALARPEDRGRIVATGSHGGAPSAGYAAAIGMRLVLFNDAGFGPDKAGISSFDVLDSAGVAAVAVSTYSARIGDGRSTFADGIISATSRLAAGLGARVGDRASDLVRALDG